MINSLTEDDFLLGGDHEIIEIDESKFEDFWIVGMIQRTKKIKTKAKINSIQKCYFEIVDNRNTETIHRIIKKHIKKGSNVYSDSWKSYCGIEKYGLKHKKVNHSKKNNRLQKMKIHTNTIESVWNALKLNLPRQNRNKKFIQKYLLQYMWYQKHKDNTWKAFINCLK